jgi:hypothetical protein
LLGVLLTAAELRLPARVWGRRIPLLLVHYKASFRSPSKKVADLAATQVLTACETMQRLRMFSPPVTPVAGGGAFISEGDMRAVLIGAFIVAMGTNDAEACHRFSRWYYPFPQRCDTRPLRHDLVYRVPSDAPLPPVVPREDEETTEIPLPDLAGVWEPLEDYKELKEGLERKKALILLLTR